MISGDEAAALACAFVLGAFGGGALGGAATAYGGRFAFALATGGVAGASSALCQSPPSLNIEASGLGGASAA